MRARALRPRPDVSATAPEPRLPPVRSPARSALVFLRGRDADGRLRELVRARATVRPRLGALAEAVVQGRTHEKLGFCCLGDWSRERIGLGARAVSEWARVWRALRELPRLRAAVLGGEVSWTVARKIVSLASPENEAACLETVRGRSVRAVEAMIEAVRAVEAQADAPEAGEDASDERLPLRSRSARAENSECGLRVLRWPWLRWDGGTQEAESVESDVGDATPLELDRRFRAAIAFLQRVDFEIGRILRQILARGLYRELGFESFEDYVVERLDLSPRTARRLVRLGAGGRGHCVPRGEDHAARRRGDPAGAPFEESPPASHRLPLSPGTR